MTAVIDFSGSSILDLLQVSLEETQDKFRIVVMNSDSDVWPRICRPAGYYNNTSFFFSHIPYQIAPILVR